jgi:MFS family permease
MLNPAAPFLTALRQRNLRLLFGGLVVSQAGDWLYNLALLAFVYERTGSSAWVGITTAARILPEVPLGPLGGVLADRHDRRAIMIASDVLRAATMGALAVLAIAGGPIVLAPVLAALCTAAGAAYPQCVVAVMPRLVSDDDLPAANAARISITRLCIIAGPVLGAVLLVLGSPAATFAINGASFLVGAVVVAALPRAAFGRPAGTEPAALAALRDELATGWHALREHPTALPLVGVEIVASAIYGASTVLFVLLAVRLGLGASGYGYLLSALGAGGILAAGLASAAAASSRPRRALLGAVVAFGVPFPLLAAHRLGARGDRARRRHGRGTHGLRSRRRHHAAALAGPGGLRARLRAGRPGVRRGDRGRRAAHAAGGLAPRPRRNPGDHRRRGAGLRRGVGALRARA